MRIDQIEDALDVKRQLLGAEALLREATRYPRFNLQVGDFKGVSGWGISFSSEWPARLILTADEVATLLTPVTRRLSIRLSDLGVAR